MRNISLYSFLILFLILILELSLRFFVGLGSPPLYYPNDRYEYFLLPNQSLKRFGNNFKTNKYGFRSQEIDLNENKIIFMIGDSVANGGILLDQTEIASERLIYSITQNNLCGESWSIANISAGSWGPLNQELFLEDLSLNNKKYLGVYIFSSHDLEDIPQNKDLDPILYPQNNPTFALEELFFKYVLRIIDKIKPSNSNIKIKKENNRAEGIKHFNSLLAVLNKKFENLIIIHHLTTFEHENGVNKTDLVAINEALSIIEEEYISDKYMYNEGSGLNDFYFDDIHLNSYGAIKLASLIEKKIKEDELLCNITE